MSIPNVTVGLNDWLFLTRGSNNLLEQHLGVRRFSDDELNSWFYTLRARSAFCSELGIKYVTYIAPNKICVYPELYPFDLTPKAPRPVLQLLERCEGLVKYHLEALMRAKSRFDVYDSVDTHWNGYGAYVAYLEICRDVYGDTFELLTDDDFLVERRLELGDLGSKLAPAVKGWVNWPTRIKREIEVKSDLGQENRGVIRRSHNSSGIPQKILIFGDSFASRFFEFFAASFTEAIFCHCPYFDYQFVEKERPDLVISHKIERFITLVPNDLLSPSIHDLHLEKSASVDLKLRHGNQFYSSIKEKLVNPGLREEAISLLQRAITIEPYQPWHHHALCEIFEEIKNFDAAELCITKAVELDPLDASLHHTFSRILRRRGKIHSALREASRAVELRPENIRMAENMRELEKLLKDIT